MKSTCRLFLCAKCRKQVLICSRCDRGQRYCSTDCSQTARYQSQQAAGYRYQQSRRGRCKHAERAHRYRHRQNKVTHQGSEPTEQSGLLSSNSTKTEKRVNLDRKCALSESSHCHFCGCSCSSFIRYHFLHRHRVPTIVKTDPTGNPS